MADWIRTRTPSAPEALSRRLIEIVGDDVSESPSALPAALVARAEDVLADIGNDRASATDLLAADALITYAMEAAAELSLDVDAIASDAAMRLAMVASRGAEA